MKRMMMIALALLAFAGCRQKDVRDFTGIDMSTLEFDSANHCVKMQYDSMQIAKKNIEMAIAKVGYVANGVTPESIGAKPKGK